LNPRIYSRQELIMEIFVRATTHDVNMYAKIQNIIKCRYLKINILVFEFLQFCTIKYYTSVTLVKPTV
jgi:hypothetical protein